MGDVMQVRICKNLIPLFLIFSLSIRPLYCEPNKSINPFFTGSIAVITGLFILSALLPEHPSTILSHIDDSLKKMEKYSEICVAHGYYDHNNDEKFLNEINKCCYKSSYPYMLALDWLIQDYLEVENITKSLIKQKDKIEKNRTKYQSEIATCESLIGKSNLMMKYISKSIDSIRRLPNYVEQRNAYENSQTSKEMAYAMNRQAHAIEDEIYRRRINELVQLFSDIFKLGRKS